MAKVKCANSITERIYGLEFNKGVSEEFDDVELLGRLLAKGYELVEETEPGTETEETEPGTETEETEPGTEETELEDPKVAEGPAETKKNTKKK